MNYVCKTILIAALFLSSMLTSTLADTLTKYIPVISDDLITFIPQKVPQILTYTPPTNSLEHTTVVTTDGKKIRVDRTPDGFVFEGYVGKIVLLEIYGYTCPHCIASIPGYNRVQAKYPKDVYVLTLESYGLSKIGLQQYIKDHNMQYATVAKEDIGNMYALVGSLTGWSPGIGVPWLMIFSRDGIMEGQPQLGDIDEAYVEGRIQKLL